MPKTSIPFEVLDEKNYAEQSDYQRLGLDKNEKIDLALVTKAYRARAILYHPDRNPSNKEKAEQIFKALGAAYESLSNKYRSRPTESKSESADDWGYEFKFHGYQFKPKPNDFPDLPGKKSKYTPSNNCHITLTFGDVIYYLSEKAMHYLVDHEALGWSWIPPDDFIQRVMKAGRIKFGEDKLDQFILKARHIGFLKKKSNPEGALEIINDFYGEDVAPAKIGRAPTYFIQRMEEIHAAYISYLKNFSQLSPLSTFAKTQFNHIDFIPHPEFDKIALTTLPEKALSYRQKFTKLLLQNQKNSVSLRQPDKPLIPSSRHVDQTAPLGEFRNPYFIASEIRFFSVNEELAVSDMSIFLSRLSKGYNASTTWEYLDDIHHIRNMIDDIFAAFDIKFEKNADPLLLIIKKDNLMRLKNMGAELIHLNKDLTLDDKIALTFGCKPISSNMTENMLEVTLRYNDFGYEFRWWLQENKNLLPENQKRSAAFGATRSIIKCEHEGIGSRFTQIINEKISQNDKILDFITIENAKRNQLYALYSPKQGQRRKCDEEKNEEQPAKKMKIW